MENNEEAMCKVPLCVLYELFRVKWANENFFKKLKTSCTKFFWDVLQLITLKEIKNSEGHG